jgi:hypothetical protein
MDTNNSQKQQQQKVYPKLVTDFLLQNQCDNQKYLAALRASIETTLACSSLVKVIALPTTKIDRGINIHGAAIVFRKDMPADMLFTCRELCGGVSAYFVKFNDVNPVPKIKEHIAVLHECVPLSDDPSDVMNAGNSNMSAGVYKSVDRYTHAETWMIVVRAYHEGAAEALRSYSKGKTVATVLNSTEYNAALNFGNALRNKMAASIAEAIGAHLINQPTKTPLDENKVSSGATPDIVNHYNYVDKVFYENEHVMCYYNHCYNTNECKNGILFGINRQQGYTWLGGAIESGSDRSWQSKRSANAYPMGNPVRMLRNELKKSDANGIRDKVYWKGVYEWYNYKAVPALYHEYHNETKWEDLERNLGYCGPKGTLTALNISVYISAPDDTDMRMSEILTFKPDNSEWVIVPCKHEFVLTRMMRGYVDLKSKYPDLKWKDIFRGETTEHFMLNAKYIAEIDTKHEEQQQK